VNKAEFIEWAKRHNLSQDKYGHFSWSIDQKTHRYKLQDNSVRHEIQHSDLDGSHYWLRIQSNYFSHMSLSVADRLVWGK
jgi:hypothetical protein